MPAEAGIQISKERLDSRSLGVTLAIRSLTSCLRGNDVW